MKLLFTTVASALALAGVAFAAPPRAPPKLFLSPSGEPFRPTPQAPDPVKTWFDQVDTKHQGFIDKDEFRADAIRFFKRLDQNGDGVIDGFEVADYEHKMVPEIVAEAEGGRFVTPAAATPGGSGGPRNGGGGGGGRGHGRGEARDSGEAHPSAEAESGHDRGPAQRAIQQLIGEPEPVSGADFNLDSHITLDEWMRATDQRFDILDEHKDGKLTFDELEDRFKPMSKAP